jgi:hypothetical protein
MSAMLASGCARAALACSQCMCGTPFPADALGGVVPMQLRYGFEDRYLSKTNGLDEGPGEEREREHRLSAFAVWRPRDRFALLGRLPYNFKELEQAPLGQPVETANSQGLGDAELLALIGVARASGTHPATLGLVLGMAAPTGSNNLKGENGERLDEHLQTGTGAWSLTTGLNLGASLGGSMVESGVLARVNFQGPHYRYGNALLFNAGLLGPLWGGWRGIAQLNGRTAAHDLEEGGEPAPNTGGTVLYATPGLKWQGVLGVGVEALVQIPVFQSLQGIQHENTTARLGLSLDR